MKARLEFEMPECCERCPVFDSYCTQCNIGYRDLGEEIVMTKPDWCPLVPVVENTEVYYTLKGPEK